MCGKEKEITEHHLTIKPRRKNKKIPSSIPLCRNCHDAIELAKSYILKERRLRKAFNRGYKKGFEDGKLTRENLNI